MTNVIIHNVPYHPGTTGKISVIRTPPRVTKSIWYVKISVRNKQSGVRSNCRRNRLSPTPEQLVDVYQNSDTIYFVWIIDFNKYEAEFMAMLHDE